MALWKRKAAFPFAGIAALGVVAWITSGSGGPNDAARAAALAAVTCNPTVAGAPPEVFDGNTGTFWRLTSFTSHTVTIDLGCTANLRRFRRFMTCDGAATSGTGCIDAARQGHRGMAREAVSYSFNGIDYQVATPDNTNGWEAYGGSSGIWTSIPYGWSPFLDFQTAASPQGVTARYLQFHFTDLGDALNEMEVDFAEVGGPAPTPTPTPTPPPPGSADLILSVAGPEFLNSDSGTAPRTLTITIRNDGPAPATGVRMQASGELGAPASWGLVGPETCGALVGVSVTCNFGTLAPGATLTVTLSQNFLETGDHTAFVVGAAEYDPNTSNNRASAGVTVVDCDNLFAEQACTLLSFLAELICQAQTPGAMAASASGAGFLSRIVGKLLAIDIDVFHALRRDVFPRTPAGRRYNQLYDTHGPEMTAIVIANPALRQRGAAAIQLWEGHLRALVDGAGSQAVITAQQIAELEAVLEEFKRLGSPALRSAITQEQAALNLSTYVGRTMDQALSRFQQPGCVEPETSLCLNGGRFRATVSWRDSQGRAGVGRAAPLTSDTGYFWFFNPENVELTVKALDARALNGNFWVFYGSLSNVEYTLTVTDTLTGGVRTYTNPAGNFASAGDTAAFPGIAGGAAPAPSLLPAPSTCDADGRTLCLTLQRFEASIAWRDFQGRTGVGQAVPLTSDTGYFWFFDPQNVEVVVKVLDARPINGRFWVFYGALSNVEYTLTVRDRQTGAVKTYSNPANRFGSVGDTAAF